MARLWAGMFELRDQFFLMHVDSDKRQLAQNDFDKKYKPLLESVKATRDAALTTLKVVREYISDINSGKDVGITNNQVQILRSIDTELSQNFNEFLNQSVVATKSSLSQLLRAMFGIDIGFLFQKEVGFNIGIKALTDGGEIPLANYLIAIRSTWLSNLMTLRNSMEHEGWVLEPVKYAVSINRKVYLDLPLVNSIQVDKYIVSTANRVLLFVENMMVYGMLSFPRYPLYISEIPETQRDPTSPKRFKLSAIGLDESPPWEILYFEANDFVK